MQDRVKSFIEQQHQILPIINLNDSKHQATDIIPVIDALLKGSVNIAEITLRSNIAFDAISIAKEHFPDFSLCIGSVTTTEQIQQLQNCDIEFIITPGINEQLLISCEKNKLDILPGVMTPSDILLGLQYNLQYFKFFPAAPSGNPSNLKDISMPFSSCMFLATGGINDKNANDFLSMENVFGIATSQIVSSEDIENKNWASITQKANTFNALARP